MDSGTVNVFLTALSAMSKVFLVSLAGVLGAYFPRDKCVATLIMFLCYYVTVLLFAML